MAELDPSAIDSLAARVLESGVAPAVALAVTDATGPCSRAPTGPPPRAPDWTPERLRFDTVVDGVAQRAVLSGTP